MEKLYEKLKFTKHEKNTACETCKGTGEMQYPYKKETCLSCDGSGKVYDPLKAGDVLKLKDGNIKLVGNINEFFGVCDDCTIYDHEDVVEKASIFQLDQYINTIPSSVTKEKDLPRQEKLVIAALLNLAINVFESMGNSDVKLPPDILQLISTEEWLKIGGQATPDDITVIKYFAKKLQNLAEEN